MGHEGSGIVTSNTDHQRRVQPTNSLAKHQCPSKTGIAKWPVPEYPVYCRCSPADPAYRQTWWQRRILFLLGFTILRELNTEKLGETGEGTESEASLHDQRDDRDGRDLRVQQSKNPSQDDPDIVPTRGGH
jgi:hypothetical protein